MNTNQISDYLFNNNEAITNIYLLNGHPVLSFRDGIDRVVVVGDTYSERETLKAHGYIWNRDERVFEKRLVAGNADSLPLELCYDKNVYVHLSLQLISMRSHRPVEAELKAQLGFLADLKENGLVEHD
jgi:hypothetical protein